MREPSVKRTPRGTPKVGKDRSFNEPGIFAGWIDEKHGIAWVVSPHRLKKGRVMT